MSKTSSNLIGKKPICMPSMPIKFKSLLRAASYGLWVASCELPSNSLTDFKR